MSKPIAGARRFRPTRAACAWLRALRHAALLVGLGGAAAAGAWAADAVFKCAGDRGVTYQSHPCPSGASRPPPTVQQLNAERQRRLHEQAAPAATAVAPSRVSRPWSEPAARRVADAPASAQVPTAGGAFRCDGRTHCSQMRSCAEATFFLAHCPGVQMDGNHDGVPCEQQWCGGASAENAAGRVRRGRH